MGAVDRIGVWLHERSGTPDRPNPRLLAAWAAGEWTTVITECEAWIIEQVDLINAADTDEDRQRIASEVCWPIRAVQEVAQEMRADPESRRRRRAHHTLRLLRELYMASSPPTTDTEFRLAAERIAAVFEEAALCNIDLSRRPEEQW
jgi:hypothetical protein